jgi:hypothetical protein
MKGDMFMKINSDLKVGDTSAILYDIKTHNDKLYQVGRTLDTGDKVTTAQQGTDNFINSLSIPKGTWIVAGTWSYQGNDLSTYTSLNGIDFTTETSAYDNLGYVSGNAIGLCISNGSAVAKLDVWPRNKTVPLRGRLWAVKIAN